MTARVVPASAGHACRQACWSEAGDARLQGDLDQRQDATGSANCALDLGTPPARGTLPSPARSSRRANFGVISSLPHPEFIATQQPSGNTPQSSPDNILILPNTTWHSLFDAQGPRNQKPYAPSFMSFWIAPGSPADFFCFGAFQAARQMANNIETRTAGSQLCKWSGCAARRRAGRRALRQGVVPVPLRAPALLQSGRFWSPPQTPALAAPRRMRASSALLRTLRRDALRDADEARGSKLCIVSVNRAPHGFEAEVRPMVTFLRQGEEQIGQGDLLPRTAP